MIDPPRRVRRNYPGPYHRGPLLAMDPSGLPGALMSVFVIFGTIALFTDRAAAWPFLGMMAGFAFVIVLYAAMGIREGLEDRVDTKAADDAVDAWISEVRVPRPCDRLGTPLEPPEP